MRHQGEANEILVVAQRQQIRELEGQVAALRAQHKEQLLALSKVRVVVGVWSWHGRCVRVGGGGAPRRPGREATWMRQGADGRQISG